MNDIARSWVIMCSTVAVVVAATLGSRALQNRPAETPRGNGIAVLELYTSEGCSSCPAADDLLGLIVRQSRADHSRIYPLEFHVDTWNQPTFSDPFSEARFRERQESYYNAKITREVFTPQMIINGTRSEIGSDSQAVRAKIEQATREPLFSEVTLAVTRSDQELVAEATLSAIPAGGVLNVVLVERGLVHEIPKGENAGRTLHHENVVRSFVSTPLAQPKASVKLPIPPGAILSNCSVIAYVQNAKLSVLGAAEASLPAEPHP